jgi:hypothetical protein
MKRKVTARKQTTLQSSLEAAQRQHRPRAARRSPSAALGRAASTTGPHLDHSHTTALDRSKLRKTNRKDRPDCEIGRADVHQVVRSEVDRNRTDPSEKQTAPRELTSA